MLRNCRKERIACQRFRRGVSKLFDNVLKPNNIDRTFLKSFDITSRRERAGHFNRFAKCMEIVFFEAIEKREQVHDKSPKLLCVAPQKPPAGAKE